MSRSVSPAHTTSVEERLDLRSEGPFAVGAALWLRGPGQLVATTVVKATYALDHDLSALLDEPDPVQAADDHWDDDERKSVHVPSDLALMKPQSEVVLVGHAHAPKERPTQSIMVRVAVGSVDKIIETATSRRYTREGVVEQSAASHRMSLRYELAPGGPDTENPVGIDPGLFDEASQRWRIPQVLPANHLVEPGEYIQKIGVGPISPTWPGRATLLRPEDRAWLADPTARPIPVGFDPRFFCVAPADQRMNEPFRADERILLEGLSPQHPRLVTNLAGVAPVLTSQGGSPMPQLVADTIYIDSDRGVVTMTFRAHVALEEGRAPLRLRVRAGGGASAGRSFSVPAAARPSGEETIELGRVGGSVADALNTTNVELDPEVARSIVLPFASASQRNPQTSHHDDGALPFRAAGQPPSSTRRTPVPPPMSQAQMPASLPPMGPPPMAPPPPPSRASVSPAPPSVVPPAVALSPLALVPPAPPSAVSQPPPPPPPPAPMRGQTVGEQAANHSVPALARDATPPRPPPSMGGSMGGGSMMGSPASVSSSPSSRDGDPFSAAFGGKPTPSGGRPPNAASGSTSSNVPAPKPSTSGGLGGGAPLGATLGNLVPGGSMQSAKSASDQAADRERPRRALEEESRSEGTAVRRALVDLLSFSPEVPRRIRRTKWMTALLTDFSPPRPFRRPDEPEPDREKDREERGRFEVLRVLSCGQPLDTSQLNMAVERALEDANDLEMPLFLVAGELKPTYDEVEMLKAAVRVAQPLSNNDKRLAATVAVATEAANASTPPSNETAGAMSRQIEAALRELSLPPRYLAENVERILLEGRAYKKRTVLGEQRIRCDLSLGASPAWPTYLPEATGAHLPMLVSFSVVALVEVRPREDASEVHTDALVVTALGRVVRSVRR